jgi:hypothetical protein
MYKVGAERAVPVEIALNAVMARARITQFFILVFQQGLLQADHAY